MSKFTVLKRSAAIIAVHIDRINLIIYINNTINVSTIDKVLIQLVVTQGFKISRLTEKKTEWSFKKRVPYDC